MAENRTRVCEWVDLISDHPHYWLAFAEGHPADAPSGPYKMAIGQPLRVWITVADEGERMRRAFHILRVHMGEETEERGCPAVPRAGRA